MKIVLIDWVDSGGNDVVWENKDTWELEPLPCKTVGFLLKKTPKYVVISQSDSPDQHGRLFVIPRGAITSMVKLS